MRGKQSISVGCVGLFRRRKTTNVPGLPPKLYHCSPFSADLAKGDAAVSGRVSFGYRFRHRWHNVAWWPSNRVRKILCSSGNSKVRNTVVRFVAVDVVDLAVWPYAVNIKPCQAVGTMPLPSDCNVPVPYCFKKASCRCLHTAGTMLFLPPEMAAIGIVAQSGKEVCVRYGHASDNNQLEDEHGRRIARFAQ